MLEGHHAADLRLRRCSGRFRGARLSGRCADLLTDSASPTRATRSSRAVRRREPQGHDRAHRGGAWLHVAGRFRRDAEPHPLRAFRDASCSRSQGVREAILALPYPRCVASSSTAGTDRLLAPAHRARRTSSRTSSAPARSRAASRRRTCSCMLPRAWDATRGMPRHRGFEAGVQAARAAGMNVIGFAGGGHCGPDHADKLKAAGASIVIERMTDLTKTVQAFA